jgi:hypothetical protein
LALLQNHVVAEDGGQFDLGLNSGLAKRKRTGGEDKTAKK